MSITQPQALKQLLEHNDQVARERLSRETMKRREIGHRDELAFWEATARYWQQHASKLSGLLESERATTQAAVHEMEQQNVERAHWLKDAEQHRTDCIKAEQRSDALGDILDALKQGYQIEEFPGRATWWTMDTDTLAQIAKDARDWQLGESEKPPVYMGKGEGEPFTMGGQEFKPEDQPVEDIPFIVWEWGYRPASLHSYDVVEAKLANGLVAAGIAANIVWDAEDCNAVTAYRVLRFHKEAMAEREKMIAVVEKAYSQGMPQTTKPLRAMNQKDLSTEFDLATRFICETEARIERERLAQEARTATEPTKAEVEAEELIGIADRMCDGIEGLPADFQVWADDIHNQIRQVAHRLNQK
ncbi:hypothetical protein [Kosakonia phage Kc166B]|nr:hypothetical protein [Kosakonia phage Kc237]QQV88693.1 hypothetical protein [Kosakonia phage Kc166B]